MTGRRSLGIGMIALLGLMGAWLGPAAEVEPQLVYVGARICGECHAGPGVNYQYSKWLSSKHSQAYAALAQPEARRIARLSGVREDPQRAFACLGCHTTAAHAEQWQRDETYRIEDGVQCETCHGPGSAHVEEYRRPGPHSKERGRMEVPRKEQLCISCHGAKGSHVAVLKTPAFDLEKAWREVAHPVPEHPKGGSIPTVSAAERNQRAGPTFVGSYTCGKCHRGPEFGYQYSRWRRSAHARAWAVLATEKARQMARAMGVEEDPQRAARCLKCHTTAGAEPPEMLAASYEIDEGVGCEACHGPGSEYMAEAIMRDRRAARQHGLRVVSKETCQRCHENAHGRPFRVDLSAVAHFSKLAQDTVEEVRYKTPWNLAFRPNSTELWVTCSGSDTVAIVDWRSREKLAEVAVGAQPFAISFSPDGRWAYVTNLFEDTISVIDASARQQTGKIAVGDEPHGIYATPDGRRVLVANAMSEDVTVLLASSGKLEREKTLAASRRAWWLAASPDGERIILTHALPYLVPFRTPSVAEVTVIAADRAVVEDRIRVEGANLLLGAAWHPSGEYALTTLNRTKNLVPMTRLLQGWTITNGLAVVWRNGEVDQVLLDEPGMCFPDPTGLAVTPDGRYALATSSGSDRVAVVDLDRLTAIIRHATAYERRHVLPNHLGKPVEFVVAHIPTGKSPRGIVVSPEGRLAFVAEALDDAIAVIDLHERRVVSRIDLGGPRQITKERWGEQLFHSARNTFQRQFSCQTCHPRWARGRHHVRYRAGRYRRQPGGQPFLTGSARYSSFQVGRD